MADIGLNPAAWTDPRLMLAQQLMSQSTDASPVRSWTQELARALAGPVGAYEATQVRGERNQALADVYNPSGSTPNGGSNSDQPGLFGRIGNFLTGRSSSGSSGSTTSGSPSGPQTTDAQTSGATGVNPASQGTSGAPASGSGTPQAAAAQTAPTPSQTPSGPLAQQLYIGRRMMQVGQERNMPDLVQQGAAIIQAIQQKQAEAQAGAAGEMYKQGMVLDPGSNTVTPLNGYRDVETGNEAAKSKGTALGNLDPSVTAGKIGQENAINTGTMGTAAQKAGAVSGAEAGARNASDLAYAAPITTAKDQAAADVAYKNTPALEAAKLEAANAVNAGKPLTPVEKNNQEQKLSKDFQDLPIVKEHIAASQGYQNVLAAAAGKDKASDINLIDALVKMFNPGATVRQSTFENFMEHSQGIPDNIKGIVGSVMNGAHLQPETRAQLVAQAQERMNSSRQVYNQLAGFASQQAQSQGLNVKNVVPNFIDPLTAQEIAKQRGLIP